MSRSINFVSPRSFERNRRGVLSDDQLEAVKQKLALKPDLGDMVPQTGGARKVRQEGRRGNARVIYYYHPGSATIFFLLSYSKNERTDLTAAEKKDLKSLVKMIKANSKR